MTVYFYLLSVVFYWCYLRYVHRRVEEKIAENGWEIAWSSAAAAGIAAIPVLRVGVLGLFAIYSAERNE